MTGTSDAESRTERTTRFTGRQIVAIVVAVCAAVTLAPAGVVAASSFAKVRIVDASHPSHVAAVTKSGRILTSVQSPVTTRSTLPASAFSVQASGNERLSEAIPAFTKGTLYITSITLANAGDTSTDNWIEGYKDSSCTQSNHTYTYIAAQPLTTYNVVFPTPLIIKQPCASIHIEADGSATITGYRGA